MLTGYIDKISSDTVHGWAADTDEPDAVIEVAIYVDGRRVAQVACSELRKDLRDLGRYGAGRHGFHHVFTPPLPPLTTERVTVRFARTGAILPNGDAALSRWQPLSPILITAPGRSGTTLLMSRLARLPQITVGEMHPYEVRQIAYWSTVVRTLSRPADFDRATHPDRLEGDGYRVGTSPFSHFAYRNVFRAKELDTEYFGRYVPAELHDLARRMILEYYLRIRDDRQKPDAVFFAEKNNNLDRRTREFARTLFPDLKELVLVRDPRDLLCSQMAYFRRDPEAIFQNVSQALREYLRIRHEANGQVLFLRYEDLVLHPGALFDLVGAHLGTDCSDAIDVEQEHVGFAAHATSASPAASIERWRSHMPSQLLSRCASAWSEYLGEFGYAHA
jgi:hypothetical protein